MPQSETPQETLVDTGLAALTQPQAQTPSAETPVAATPAPEPAAPEPPVSTEPIQFAEPISANDLIAGVGDRPEDAVPLISQQQLAALQRQAENDNTKRDFTLRVLAARAKANQPEPAPPPVAPQIAEQTRLEMEAGRKMNDHHAKLAARRPPPPQEKDTAVFRPGDWTPDQLKGQGYNQARTLS